MAPELPPPQWFRVPGWNARDYDSSLNPIFLNVKAGTEGTITIVVDVDYDYWEMVEMAGIEIPIADFPIQGLCRTAGGRGPFHAQNPLKKGKAINNEKPAVNKDKRVDPDDNGANKKKRPPPAEQGSVELGQLEVFYMEGATQEEANRLGARWLTFPGTGNAQSLQLKKSADGYQVRFPIRKEALNDEMAIKSLELDVARISRDVFDGATVELHACDEFFNTLKVIPQRADIRYGLAEGKVEVFFAAESDKQDAQRLARFMANKVVANADFKLARRGEVVEVHVAVKKRPETEMEVADMRRAFNGIAANVFPGVTVELHLCNESLDVLQVLKK